MTLPLSNFSPSVSLPGRLVVLPHNLTSLRLVLSRSPPTAGDRRSSCPNLLPPLPLFLPSNADQNRPAYTLTYIRLGSLLLPDAFSLRHLSDVSSTYCARHPRSCIHSRFKPPTLNLWSSVFPPSFYFDSSAFSLGNRG